MNDRNPILQRLRQTLATGLPALLSVILTGAAGTVPICTAQPVSAESGDLQVEVSKRGAVSSGTFAKEVSIRKGPREWFMMIEVTPENTVVVRQEKENETYIVDESENHDRAMTSGEVDAAIDAFINGVKAQIKTEKQK
jgi:ribosomal protein L6P/L9E